MSKHNYSQYSNNKKKNPVTTVAEDAVVTPVEHVDEVKMEVNDIIVTPVEETVNTVKLPKTVTGTVANCSKLNVRAEGCANGEVVCVLNVGTEVKVDVNKSNAEWLYVSTPGGVKGYCMRKFVNARL